MCAVPSLNRAGPIRLGTLPTPFGVHAVLKLASSVGQPEFLVPAPTACADVWHRAGIIRTIRLLDRCWCFLCKTNRGWTLIRDSIQRFDLRIRFKNSIQHLSATLTLHALFSEKGTHCWVSLFLGWRCHDCWLRSIHLISWCFCGWFRILGWRCHDC